MNKSDRIKVFLNDCQVELSIGFRSHEKLKRQAIIVHVEVEAALTEHFHDLAESSLERVIDYSKLYNFITVDLPALGHIALLETVADRIINFCFEDQRVSAVQVKVDKPEIYADRAQVGIMMSRTRKA